MTEKAVEAKHKLAEFKKKVDSTLEEILEKQVEDAAANYTPDAENYINQLKDICLVGGKRLRGAFVYYSYLMFGGNDEEAILEVAAAIEILHTFLLIEDDFMDIAKTRRGNPTINEYYRKYHKQNNFKKSSRHFGNTVAVNAGIIGDHIALEVLNNVNFDYELIRRALSRVNKQIIITTHGQIHDILNEVKENVSEEDILNVLYWKTGIYTYDNPLQVGAIFAGADDKTLEKVSEYAIPGGVAFQIQDDILGSFGDESKTGKSSDSDIKEGKQTLLTYKAYEQATPEQRKILNRAIGNYKATKADIDKVREVFVETGALAYSKAKAMELVHNAKNSLEKNQKQGWNKEGVDFLMGIVEYMIDREI